MGEKDYTLKDPVFRQGLASGAKSESVFDKEKLMVVGGASTQLLMRDKPELLRPTTDIDFIINGPSSKSLRRTWADYLTKILKEENYICEGDLTRYGAGIKFHNLPTDFLVHLDCFGPNYFNRHKKRIEGEYERAEIINFGGTKVRTHSPMDLITNKVRRIKKLEEISLGLDSGAKVFLSLIEDAQFDESLTVKPTLNKLMKFRQQNIEDLARLGYGQILNQIEIYKVEKDIYDICSVIEASYRNNKQIPAKEFKKALNLALIA
ncbi:MAG: hypothetical protein WCX73_00660 [Candidatus Pacearchaeota archaeon]